MSKSQKRKIIRIAVRLSILAVLLFLIIGQYKSIHNLKSEIRTNSEQIMAIEKTVVEMKETTPPENDPEENPLFVYIGEFKVTGYVGNCKHCCGKTDGITASMKKATVGRTVAMNRNDIKNLGIEYGDVIYIDGIGERVVEDAGCAQGVIDVVCDSHEDCYKITGYYNVMLKGGE